MARVFRSSARDLKRISTDKCGNRASPRGVSLSTPCASAMLLLGGMTNTQLAHIVIPSLASVTFMPVAFASRSVSLLSCFGSRCCTSRNVIPVSVGNSFNSAVRASSPPAEAPTPTIGKEVTFPPETAGVFDFWLLLGIPSRFTREV
jgi:hypothetical protein